MRLARRERSWPLKLYRISVSLFVLGIGLAYLPPVRALAKLPPESVVLLEIE